MGVDVTIFPDGSLQSSATPEEIYKRLQAVEHQITLLHQRAIAIEGKLDLVLELWETQFTKPEVKRLRRPGLRHERS